MNIENVILVDKNDVELGIMDKYEAHRNPAKLHRAISVYLFNQKGELLIQQRSEQKIVGARQWANTCCGNVWPGESYEDCAKRRLSYELGVMNANIKPVCKFVYSVKCNEEYSENEMDQVFVGRYDGEVQPNPEEVSDYSWVKWNQGNLSPSMKDKEVAPWFEIMLGDKLLVTTINNSI